MIRALPGTNSAHLNPRPSHPGLAINYPERLRAGQDPAHTNAGNRLIVSNPTRSYNATASSFAAVTVRLADVHPISRKVVSDCRSSSIPLPTLFGSVAVFSIAAAVVLGILIKPTVRPMEA